MMQKLSLMSDDELVLLRAGLDAEHLRGIMQRLRSDAENAKLGEISIAGNRDGVGHVE